MFWNIVIAVGAGIAQLGNAWLGWRVTSLPNRLSSRQRKTYDMLFIVCGLVGLFLIGLATYRAGRERAHLKLITSLDVRLPTTLEDIWSASDIFLRVNLPLRMNVYYQNVGNGPAINMRHQGTVYIEPDYSLASVRDAVQKFETWRKTQTDAGAGTTAKDENGFATFKGDILTPEDSQNIKSGRRIVFVVGEFTFDDDLGSHYHKVCDWLQPPEVGGAIIFGHCPEYTEEN
jgi:hypothetical protein